jgi:hypothetical protein
LKPAAHDRETLLQSVSAFATLAVNGGTTRIFALARAGESVADLCGSGERSRSAAGDGAGA